jgi:hypothetical protein
VARLLEGFFAVDDESSATLVRTSLRGARREFLKIDTLKDLWSLRKV